MATSGDDLLSMIIIIIICNFPNRPEGMPNKPAMVYHRQPQHQTDTFPNGKWKLKNAHFFPQRRRGGSRRQLCKWNPSHAKRLHIFQIHRWWGAAGEGIRRWRLFQEIEQMDAVALRNAFEFFELKNNERSLACNSGYFNILVSIEPVNDFNRISIQFMSSNGRAKLI